ncbi:hypothetical protein ThrDRAFT_04751 [Frankia casuarinae]|uniref:Transposase, IS605 OrfB n=1 Tax=Frankia casuarinae (strain DSM 45818 / CECT 9043 / HFP020203 / CcI3) TaxID=106370 RepID=Q2JBK1_FRACC|nr:transposase, IS605 OrfB [Frankia casuarinae]EYT89634.1 hypothetical protein ThrDRAFT_04751 [Frankia casuarinae]
MSRTACRWFVSFTVEVEREVPTGPSRRQRAAVTVGVDLGVRHLAVLSTGETVANPKPLARSLRKLRRDGPHKLTTRLATSHETIVVEDLPVAGMVRNRRLARAVSDTGMAEVRRQLAYKTLWYGSTLVVADRWYPSSKTCSGCGGRNPNLTLPDRIFTCPSCGLVADRDANAAVNLRHLVAASTSETINARGADRKTHPGGRVAVKREPGTAMAGKSVTRTTEVASGGKYGGTRRDTEGVPVGVKSFTRHGRARHVIPVAIALPGLP